MWIPRKRTKKGPVGTVEGQGWMHSRTCVDQNRRKRGRQSDAKENPDEPRQEVEWLFLSAPHEEDEIDAHVDHGVGHAEPWDS